MKKFVVFNLILSCFQILILLPLFMPKVRAQEASRQEGTQAGKDSGDPASISSEGAMYRANLLLTGVYRTKGVSTLGGKVWASPNLFMMKRKWVTTEFGRDVNLSGVGTVFFPARDWSINTGYDYSDPIIANDTIYFSLYIGEGQLFALDAASGQVKWRARRIGGAFTAPCVAGDTLYVGSSGSDGSFFYAMNLRTQDERWRYLLGSKYFVSTPPIVANRTVYFGTSDGRYYALDVATGQKKWIFETGQKGYLTTPTINGLTIYFGDQKGILHAVDANTGQENWKLKIKGGVSSLAIAADTLFVNTAEGQIYTVDLKAGPLLSKLSKDVKVGTPVAINDGLVYFAGTTSNIYAINAATGELQWKLETKTLCSSPVMTEGTVYFNCADGKLNAADAKTGKVNWSLATGKGAISTPLIASGILYFISDDGHVYAMK